MKSSSIKLFVLISLLVLLLTDTFAISQLRVPLMIVQVFVFFILQGKISKDPFASSLLFLMVFFLIQFLILELEILTSVQSLLMVILYLMFYSYLMSMREYRFVQIKALSTTLLYILPIFFVTFDFSGSSRLAGIFSNPNGTAHTALVLLPLGLVGLNRKYRRILFAIIFCLIIATGSRSALLGFGLSICVLYISSKYVRKINMVNMSLLMSIVIFVSWNAVEFVANFSGYLEVLFGSDSHLVYSGYNGRDIIWELAISQFKESPLIGQGFDSAKFSLNDHVLGTHNSYIEVLLKGGVIALAQLIIMILILLNRICKSKNEIVKPFALMSLAIILSLSTNSSIFFVFNYFFYYFLIIYALSQSKITLRSEREVSVRFT